MQTHPQHTLSWTGTVLAAAITVLAGCGTTRTNDSPPLPTAATTLASGSETNSPTAASAESDAINVRFAKWLQHFRIDARKAGISESTLDQALGGVRHLPHVSASDRAQPEFNRTIWDYVDGVMSPARVSRGREQGAVWQRDLEQISQRYGVPPSVLLAVWGIESNFGTNYGNLSVLDALSTLAFDGRREAWARSELIAALRIVERGDMAPTAMLGSWAGAMGQTQFLPSVYLAHGVDGDNDGRVDIWTSMPDVLHSTANFIARSGWQRPEGCVTEVRLPPSFDAVRADTAIRQDSTEWQLEGLRAVEGGPLPWMTKASVLLPAGVRGPAFLVGDNYRAILRYNNATSYALGVCLLAQRIAGGAGVQAPWPRDIRPLTRSEIVALQTALNERGFDSGAPDGRVGPATRKALQAFQKSRALPADGYPTMDLLNLLRASP